MNEQEYWKMLNNKYRMIEKEYIRNEEFWGSKRVDEQPVHQFYAIRSTKKKYS